MVLRRVITPKSVVVKIKGATPRTIKVAALTVRDVSRRVARGVTLHARGLLFRKLAEAEPDPAARDSGGASCARRSRDQDTPDQLGHAVALGGEDVVVGHRVGPLRQRLSRRTEDAK